MSIMLEARDEGNDGLPFGCLLTQIILQQASTLLENRRWRFSSRLQRDDSDDEVPIPAAMPVGFPDMASSSQTVPPSKPEINFSQIMEALAAIQGGMSTMQQSITSMQ